MKNSTHIFLKVLAKGNIHTFYQKWANSLFTEVSCVLLVFCFYWHPHSEVLLRRHSTCLLPYTTPFEFSCSLLFWSHTEGRINPAVGCVFDGMYALRVPWVPQSALLLLISFNLTPYRKVKQYQICELVCI